MQKKTLSFNSEKIPFDRVEKDQIFKDDQLSDHLVVWHKDNLSVDEEETIAQVIQSRDKNPKESCDECPSCDKSDAFKNSYANALEDMLFIKQKYEEISYNNISDQFISDLQQFQQKIGQPNVIHIYNTKKVNNSYLEPPKETLDKYGYDKFNLMVYEKIRVDVFIPQNNTAITKCHSHYSTHATTITFRCYETSFHISKLQAI